MARASNLAALAGLAAAGYMASRGRGEKGEKAPVEDRSMMERKADRIPETPKTPETPEAKGADNSGPNVNSEDTGYASATGAGAVMPKPTPRAAPKVKPVATTKAAIPVAPKASPADDAMSRAANARNAAKITREQAAKMTDPGNKAQLAKAAEDFDRNASQFERGADFARSTTMSKKAGGSIKGMKKGGLARGGMAAPMMASGGNVKAKMGGMHKMPDGKMMKDSAMKKGGMPMKDGKPAFMMGKKMMGGGMAKYAKGGGIESRGKTKGTIIRMASGGSVSSASRRADGIAQRGKTRC